MPFEFPIHNQIALRLLYSLALLVVVWALVRFARRLIRGYAEEPTRRYHLSKAAGRTGTFLAVVGIATVWSPDLQEFVTVLTVVGAGLAIALREVLMSFVARLNIFLRHLYEQGDRIEIGGVAGDVLDVRLLHTTLMETRGWVDADQSTGRLVHIPNAWVFQHAIYNYTHGFSFIWNEIDFVITVGSNVETARDLLRELAEESAKIVEQQARRELQRLAREYLVHYSILTPFVYVKVTDEGVKLTLRYLCEARKRRGTEHAITLEALRAFMEHDDIQLAAAK